MATLAVLSRVQCARPGSPGGVYGLLIVAGLLWPSLGNRLKSALRATVLQDCRSFWGWRGLTVPKPVGALSLVRVVCFDATGRSGWNFQYCHSQALRLLPQSGRELWSCHCRRGGLAGGPGEDPGPPLCAFQDPGRGPGRLRLRRVCGFLLVLQRQIANLAIWLHVFCQE